MLFALGITHVGSVTPSCWPTTSARSTRWSSGGTEEIAEVEGIGPVIAEAVAGWLVDEEHQRSSVGCADAGVTLTGPKRAAARRPRGR